MIKLNPYLNFPGTAEEAFTFYKSIFGGDFSSFQRMKDTPQASTVPLDDLDKMMHIALPLGNGFVLMASDALESMGQIINEGNNVHLSLSPESEEETRRIFQALAAGGKISVPLEKMFWGAIFGMVTDRYGIQWMVNFEITPAP